MRPLSLSVAPSISPAAADALPHAGVWTDSVLSYLWVMYRRSWPSFRGLDSDGWRFRASADASQLLIPAWAQVLPHMERWGDVKLLSITGFSPGIGCVPLLLDLCSRRSSRLAF